LLFNFYYKKSLKQGFSKYVPRNIKVTRTISKIFACHINIYRKLLYIIYFVRKKMFTNIKYKCTLTIHVLKCQGDNVIHYCSSSRTPANSLQIVITFVYWLSFHCCEHCLNIVTGQLLGYEFITTNNSVLLSLFSINGVLMFSVSPNSSISGVSSYRGDTEMGSCHTSCSTNPGPVKPIVGMCETCLFFLSAISR